MGTVSTTPAPVSLICGAVLVSFFDGAHRTHTVFAHVLAVGPADEQGDPTLTVAFPDPAASPQILASPNWYKGYKRVTGVKNVRHPDVEAGKESIAWGGTIAPVGSLKGTGPDIPQPEGDGSRPYFKRQVPQEAPRVSTGQDQAEKAREAAKLAIMPPPGAESQPQTEAPPENPAAETPGIDPNGADGSGAGVDGSGAGSSATA